MRYFWLLCQYCQKHFCFKYQPGQENLGGYPRKHHTGPIHQHVGPYYLHQQNSPMVLPLAMRPSSWQGCAETLGDPYLRQDPLPKIPNYRDLKAEHTQQHPFKQLDRIFFPPKRNGQYARQPYD